MKLTTARILRHFRNLGVTEIVAVNAVGAIRGDFLPGSAAVPDQLIDYSYSRDVSFLRRKVEGRASHRLH